MKKICCSHCDNVELEHVLLKEDTHVFICPECPNVTFEFSFPKQTEMLTRYLQGDQSVVVQRYPFAYESEGKEIPMYIDMTQPFIQMDMDEAAMNQLDCFIDLHQ